MSTGDLSSGTPASREAWHVSRAWFRSEKALALARGQLLHQQIQEVVEHDADSEATGCCEPRLARYGIVVPASRLVVAERVRELEHRVWEQHHERLEERESSGETEPHRHRARVHNSEQVLAKDDAPA
ncbi:hypothetical protein ON010_g18269 [Phytophthora cinnamomi]|nr:hypothetical protein ON010_g18269 [Phytophthora cinnamomi]